MRGNESVGEYGYKELGKASHIRDEKCSVKLIYTVDLCSKEQVRRYRVIREPQGCYSHLSRLLFWTARRRRRPKRVYMHSVAAKTVLKDVELRTAYPVSSDDLCSGLVKERAIVG